MLQTINIIWILYITEKNNNEQPVFVLLWPILKLKTHLHFLSALKMCFLASQIGAILISQSHQNNQSNIKTSICWITESYVYTLWQSVSIPIYRLNKYVASLGTHYQEELVSIPIYRLNNIRRCIINAKRWRVSIPIYRLNKGLSANLYKTKSYQYLYIGWITLMVSATTCLLRINTYI